MTTCLSENQAPTTVKHCSFPLPLADGQGPLISHIGAYPQLAGTTQSAEGQPDQFAILSDHAMRTRPAC